MQGSVAIILISWNVIFIWETGYWTRAIKRFALFDFLKSLYSDTKILSKYIPSLQRRWCEANVKNNFTSHIDKKKYFWHFCWLPYLYTFSLYENASLIIVSAETEYISTRSWYRSINFIREGSQQKCQKYFFINVWRKIVFDNCFTGFGTDSTTILPNLFQYCYAYCYSDSRNLSAPLLSLHPNIYYWASQSFDSENTRWRLFQKRVVYTKLDTYGLICTYYETKKAI
jgi:hypothetical protein